MTIVKKRTALAWELRAALWGRKEVIVALGEEGIVRRYRGYVVEVSATDVTASIDDARYDEPVLLTLGAVLSVRRPHFHEDGPEPERARPVFEPRRGPEPMPGQLLLGGTPPTVSRRTQVAMARAAGMLLSQDLMDVLGALDRAARGRESVPTTAVADALEAEEEKPSIQWTVRRLASLAELRLALAVEKRPYSWTPGS